MAQLLSKDLFRTQIQEVDWMRIRLGDHGKAPGELSGHSRGVGCIPDLGRERSGGESAPAVAGVVNHLWARRSAGARAWPYGGVRQLARVRGQALGGHVRGSDGTGGTWSGWTRSNRHLLRISTPGRLGMAWFRGGVAGAEPPHKGGPNRPDRPKLQWSVISGQWSETALGLGKS